MIKTPQRDALIVIQALGIVEHLTLTHGIWRANQPNYSLAVPA
jgi:hypothetical protein